MANIQSVLRQLYRRAIMQPTRGRENFCTRELEHAALIGQAIDPKLIARVRPNDG